MEVLVPLEMWKLQHLYRIYFNYSFNICSLLFCLALFFSTSAKPTPLENQTSNQSSTSKIELTFQDIFLFRIVDEVYTYEEVRHLYFIYQYWLCLSDDSYLEKIVNIKKLSINFKPASTMLKKHGRYEFDLDHIFLFIQLKKLLKLILYVKSQNIILKKDLIKNYYLLGQDLGCQIKDSSFFPLSKSHLFIEQLIRTEIYLRSQFLQKNQVSDLSIKSNNSSVPTDKILINNLLSLMESLERQLKDEIYW